MIANNIYKNYNHGANNNHGLVGIHRSKIYKIYIR